MTAYRSVRPTRTTTAAAIRRYPTGIARPRRRRLRYNMLMKKKKPLTFVYTRSVYAAFY